MIIFNGSQILKKHVILICPYKSLTYECDQ